MRRGQSPESLIFKIAYTTLFITIMFMTWAYMTQAESLRSFLAYHTANSVGTGFDGHPSCSFNQLCTCSNPGPDLGIVTCSNVPFGNVPLALNHSRILTLSLQGNDLQVLEDKRFVGSGIRRLQIKENNLHLIMKEALFGLDNLLWELDLRSNELTAVPSAALRNLRKLELLDLSDNKITHVSSSDFRSLESSLFSFSLAKNLIHRITEGTFSKLTNLKHLDLSENKIFEIIDRPFPNGKSFTTLYLQSNQLQQIPFDALSSLKLTKLDLSDNVIDDPREGGSGKISAVEVNLNHNRITELPPYALVNFQSVERISFASNPLQEIQDEAFKNPSIKELDLSNCLISDLNPKAFRGLEKSLRVLDLSFNNITEFPDDVFENLDNLNSLNLRDNQIDLTVDHLEQFSNNLHSLNLINTPVSHDVLTFAWRLQKLRNLNSSEASSTALTLEVFNGSGPGLEEINLNHGKLTSVGRNAFAKVPGLKYLDLSYNRISTIDSNAFNDIGRTLIRLRIVDGLRMSSVPGKVLDKLMNLKELDLSSNDLNAIAEDSFSNAVEYINFRFNRISSISSKTFPLETLSNLKRLLLGFNSLQEIPAMGFHGLRKLEYLELNENKISKIQPRGFVHLNELKVLTLAGNKIATLSKEAFQNLPQLQILDLSHNLLKFIDFDAFDTIGTLSLVRLQLSHNKLTELLTEAEQASRNAPKPPPPTGKISNSSVPTTTTTTVPPPRVSLSSSTIEMMDLSNNDITYISTDFFYPISNTLIELDLSHNSIENITDGHFQGMTFLQRLDLSHNDLETIDEDLLQGTKALQIFEINSNQLRTLPQRLFQDCSKLRVISLADNEVSNIDAAVFGDTSLEILDLSGNNLNNFPERALAKVSASLVTLDVSRNGIASLFEQLECLTSIRRLNLARNKIVFMADTIFDKIQNILQLDLSFNPLARLTERMFESIEDTLIELNIANVGLEALPNFNFTQLITLDASGNKLVGMPVDFGEDVPLLKEADFSGNQFLNLPNFITDVFPQLGEISLGDNPIRNLRNDSFYRIQSLHTLDIAELPLEAIQLGVLQPLTSLDTLRIGPLEGKTLAAVLEQVPTLDHLKLVVHDNVIDLSAKVALPYKISKLTLTGSSLTTIANASLDGLRSRELELIIEDTGLSDLPSSFFNKLGWVNQLKLTVRGNNSELRTIKNPNLKYRPSATEPYLVDLDIESPLRMACNCDSGWIEHWLGHWMEKSCSANSDLNNYLQCEEMLNTLRSIQCRDKAGTSLMQAFADLDCGWSSAARNYISSLSLSLVILSTMVTMLF
ncbi:unnamed protein product [Allacma fusca]|uniref:Chaoptin n=1 Tax=Allacma fusca TaxID=39272 RepID=A0A8J2JB65_9HEXA|nr:unnamed protein product [Allacma fusca]